MDDEKPPQPPPAAGQSPGRKISWKKILLGLATVVLLVVVAASVALHVVNRRAALSISREWGRLAPFPASATDHASRFRGAAHEGSAGQEAHDDLLRPHHPAAADLPRVSGEHDHRDDALRRGGLC